MIPFSFRNQLDRYVAKRILRLIECYQKTLSPDEGLFSPWLKGKICAHEPHCSLYAKQCVIRYGTIQSISKITTRVLHCTPQPMTKYDPSYYRVVFFSSAPIGVPFLQELAQDKRFELVGVVTQPDKPVGRGLQLQENPIKQAAKALAATKT